MRKLRRTPLEVSLQCLQRRNPEGRCWTSRRRVGKCQLEELRHARTNTLEGQRVGRRQHLPLLRDNAIREAMFGDSAFDRHIGCAEEAACKGMSAHEEHVKAEDR